MTLFASKRLFIFSLVILILLAACNQAKQPTQENEASLNLQGLGLDAQYYASNDFSGPRKTQIDRYIWFDWGSAAPVTGLPTGKFSARWQGEIAADDSDEYQFFIDVTGKAKLTIDGKRIRNGDKLRLNAGERHNFTLEYQKTSSEAALKLMWQAKHGEREVIPQSSFFPLGFVDFELMNVLTGQNLLQNSDFSNDSASWLTFGGVSAVVPIVGGQALRANNFAWVQQNLPVSNIEVGQTYSLNARARTLSNCSVGFAGGGDNGRTFDERVSFRSNTWQEESLVVTMPEGTKWIAVYIASAKENCFVDELSLIAGDATAPVKNNRTIILNGSFEEGESFWNRFGGQSAITEGLTGQGYQADNFAWVQQDIPINLVEAGRRYILKGSAKTSGQSVCRVGIKFFGGGQTLVNTGFDFNSTDWEDKVVEFDLEAEPEWIAIFLATGRSSCTFDDLVLTTVETDAVPYDYLVASDAGEKGVWSEVADWPIIALHMALLGNGDVMTFGSGVGSRAQAFVYDVWSPAKGLGDAAHVLLEDQSPTDLFCSSQILRPDGSLMMVGGTVGGGENRGSADINFFDSVTGTMSLSPLQMTRGRWYPTATTLANGDVVMQSGYDLNKVDVNTPEVWTDEGWRILTGAENTRAFGQQNRFYPWSFVAPSGKVFIAGPRSEMFLFDTEGEGSVESLGQKDSANLFRDYGNASMFNKNKILIVGGSNTPSNRTYVIDIEDETNPQVTLTTPPNIARRHANSTILPTGDVLVSGGTSGAGFNDESKAVFAAESWNPETQAWTALAEASIVRTYHSTAILLPNGAILNSGGGKCGCEIDNFNAQVYLPSYLFKKDGSGELAVRPSITSNLEQLEYNTSFDLSVRDASKIARVTLLRSGSTTHAWNNDQRFLELDFTVGVDNTLQVIAPEGPTYAPPGFFMLFVIDDQGVPSVANMVSMQP